MLLPAPRLSLAGSPALPAGCVPNEREVAAQPWQVQSSRLPLSSSKSFRPLPGRDSAQEFPPRFLSMQSCIMIGPCSRIPSVSHGRDPGPPRVAARSLGAFMGASLSLNAGAAQRSAAAALPALSSAARVVWAPSLSLALSHSGPPLLQTLPLYSVPIFRVTLPSSPPSIFPGFPAEFAIRRPATRSA